MHLAFAVCSAASWTAPYQQYILEIFHPTVSYPPMQPDTDLIFSTERRENIIIGTTVGDDMRVVAKEDAEYCRYLYSEGSAV